MSALKVKRLKQHVIQGVVVDTRYNKGADDLEHLLLYPDETGAATQRWFLASQLETVDIENTDAPADTQEGA